MPSAFSPNIVGVLRASALISIDVVQGMAMADVALLYEGEDIAIIEKLAKELESRGWTILHVVVRSDLNKITRPEISDTMDRGHTVVALWSERSCLTPMFVEAAKLAHKNATLLSVRTAGLDNKGVPRYVTKRGLIPCEVSRVDAALTRILNTETIDPRFAKSLLKSPTLELLLWTYILWSIAAVFLSLPSYLDITLLSLEAIKGWRTFIDTNVHALAGNLRVTIDKSFYGIVAFSVFAANVAYFSRDERMEGLTREFRMFPDGIVLALANFFLLVIFVGTSEQLPNDLMLGLVLRLIEIFNTPGSGIFLVLLFAALNVIPVHMGDLHSYNRKVWIFIFAVLLVMLQIDVFKFRLLVEDWKRDLIL